MDEELQGLIESARVNLSQIVNGFAENLDTTDVHSIKNKIRELQKNARMLEPGVSNHTMIQDQITLLNDINKINLLVPLHITQDGNQSSSYLKLEEAAGGVTEKLSLVSRRQTIEQLDNIKKCPQNLNEYIKNREHYKLSIDAIIKLPKHGKITEVQREAMALDISRMLNLKTTDSSMVVFQNKPALFVPFEKIRLLKDVAVGKTMKARLFSNSTYYHYSTINPVGEGLQPDCFVMDFGEALGLSYLCSDTDFMGGHNQNKAIKNNRLYIFDQVLMSSDKLGLDSRLSMQPIKFLTRHTRHDQGRNRTLVEDSSMAAKFASIMQLIEIKPNLEKYCDDIIEQHSNKLQELNAQLKSPKLSKAERSRINQNLSDIQALRNDAEKLKNKINARIEKIHSILPNVSPSVDKKLIKKVLLLEKLFNHPVLYNDLGRPYRNPWTYRNSLHVRNITPEPNREGFLRVQFDKALPNNDLNLHAWKDAGIYFELSDKNNTLVLPQSVLMALEEHSLYPEHQQSFSPGAGYLNTQDLRVIKNFYSSKGDQESIISIVEDYKNQMNNQQISPSNKREAMLAAEQSLKQIIKCSESKGFGKHVLKKFYFDGQQELQKMMREEQRHPELIESFNAALKLDRVSLFNRVVLEALANNKLNDPSFDFFVKESIQMAHNASLNEDAHFTAIDLSCKLSQLANHTLHQLKTLSQPMKALFKSDVRADELEAVDPIAFQEKQEGVVANNVNVLLEEFIKNNQQEPMSRHEEITPTIKVSV